MQSHQIRGIALTALKFHSDSQSQQVVQYEQLLTEPQSILIPLIRNSPVEGLPHRDNPCIVETIEWLEQKVLPSLHTTETVKLYKALLTLLKMAWTHYYELMEEECWDAVYAKQNMIEPGRYKVILNRTTFKKAVKDPLFLKYVHKPLDPKLHIIRATGRCLEGQSTAKLSIEYGKRLFAQVNETAELYGDRSVAEAKPCRFDADQQLTCVDTVLGELDRTLTKLHGIWCDLKTEEMKSDAVLKPLKEAWQRFELDLSTMHSASIQLPQPPDPLGDNVTKAALSISQDWATFLKMSPSHQEIRKRCQSQRIDMLETIREAMYSPEYEYQTRVNTPMPVMDGTTDYYELLKLSIKEWLEKCITNGIADELIVHLSRKQAREEVSVVRQHVEQFSTALITMENTFSGASMTSLPLQQVIQQSVSELDNIVKTTTTTDDTAVNLAQKQCQWTQCGVDAVTIDVAMYMLEFLSRVDADVYNVHNLVQEQLHMKHVVTRLATSYVEHTNHSTMHKGTAMLQNQYMSLSISSLQNIVTSLKKFGAAFEAYMQNLQALAHKKMCQKLEQDNGLKSVSLLSQQVFIDIGQNHAHWLTQWTMVNNILADSTTSSKLDMALLSHLRNAVQESKKLIDIQSHELTLQQFVSLHGMLLLTERILKYM